MQWKLMAILSMGFAGGLAFSMACAQGSGVPGVDSAQAAEATSEQCVAWSFARWDTDADDECGTIPDVTDGDECAAPSGWEPFGAGSSSQFVLLRRCTDWE